MQVQPVLAEQIADQLQAGGKPWEAVQGQVGLKQEMGDAQVLAALQQGRACLLDIAPLRWFGRLHSVAHDALGAALGVTFQLQKLGVIFEVIAAGEVSGNSGEQRRCVHQNSISISALGEGVLCVRSCKCELAHKLSKECQGDIMVILFWHFEVAHLWFIYSRVSR
ncbi:hypothetical protein D3C79_663980 [compost metagenome]